MCIKHGISIDNSFLKTKQVKMLVYMFFHSCKSPSQCYGYDPVNHHGFGVEGSIQYSSYTWNDYKESRVAFSKTCSDDIIVSQILNNKLGTNVNKTKRLHLRLSTTDGQHSVLLIQFS